MQSEKEIFAAAASPRLAIFEVKQKLAEEHCARADRLISKNLLHNI